MSPRGPHPAAQKRLVFFIMRKNSSSSTYARRAQHGQHVGHHAGPTQHACKQVPAPRQPSKSWASCNCYAQSCKCHARTSPSPLRSASSIISWISCTVRAWNGAGGGALGQAGDKQIDNAVYKQHYLPAPAPTCMHMQCALPMPFIFKT